VMVERACACKDKACAKQVSLDFIELAKQNKNARTSGDGEERVREAGQKFGECLLTAGIEEADLERLRHALMTLHD
ncbi:MAG: hypothetical protein H0V17_13565, partial [Deltaproteobacteria bacterium]|nr:hypothetical protein [Deltaproteobacteria bacterium]